MFRDRKARGVLGAVPDRNYARKFLFCFLGVSADPLIARASMAMKLVATLDRTSQF